MYHIWTKQWVKYIKQCSNSQEDEEKAAKKLEDLLKYRHPHSPIDIEDDG